jgi:hypothetical protein
MKVDGKKLTPELRRRMALTAPFYIKGLKKKSRDTFRTGWRYERFDDSKEPSKIELKILMDFVEKTELLAKLPLIEQDAHIYGDGLLLMSFDDEDKDSKGNFLKSPRPYGLEPSHLVRLDVERINDKKFINKKFQDLGVKHFIYKEEDGSEKPIHPSRILHIKGTDFAFSDLGISDIDILRHVIAAMADIDIATGKILKWFSHGILEWKKDGANPTKIKEMLKYLNTHPDAFASDETYELKIHTPEAIDPKEFYNHVIMSIAAILVMPTHMLKGVEVGRVTGAEEGFKDYYRDIADVQSLKYKPILKKLFKILFESKNRQFNYDIVFNPIYINETTESELLSKRMATAVLGKNASIIDLQESRNIINKGQVILDVDKEIEQKSEENTKQPDSTKEVEQRVEEEKKKEKSSNTEVTKEDILQARKDIFELEQELGRRELILQEKRLKEAESKKKKEEQDES